MRTFHPYTLILSCAVTKSNQARSPLAEIPALYETGGLQRTFRENRLAGRPGRRTDMPACGMTVGQCARMAALKVANLLYYGFCSISAIAR